MIGSDEPAERPMDLNGRTALVTGASRNIGRAIATEFASLGSDVGVTSHHDVGGCRETADAVEAAGGRAAVATGDVGDPDAVTRVVESIRGELGPIDVLVNNAAVRPREAFLDVTTEAFDRVVAVNFRGPYQVTQAVVPDMIAGGRGSVINVYGLFAHTALPEHSHSFASKTGAAGLVRQLAAELGPDGVRVNGVAPGSIDTIADSSGEPAEVERRIVEATPLKRQGTAEEVADACCFLASDRASFVTGQLLHVNGGLYPSPLLLDLP